MQLDDMIADLQREQRARTALVIGAVIGIIAGAIGGLAFGLGAIDARGATGPRNPAGLIFFLAPYAVAQSIGYVIYRWLRRSRA
ncbi:MAG TPA: hypothetical protein VFQ53_23780 [Kofleriaceae bacterium]|nr:hypothetical protein [Kofleriaceae bacterium]